MDEKAPFVCYSSEVSSEEIYVGRRCFANNMKCRDYGSFLKFFLEHVGGHVINS